MTLSVAFAEKLIDFRGRIGDSAARAQLEGAVAVHNILEQNSVAYLADEVGMGKTYVALGALALFRHLDPTFRVLVIAPRENIQEKWIKELRNFVKNNYRLHDLRVKAIHDAPARATVSCANLYDFLRETKLDPDRDFFMRLSSFSFGLSEDTAAMMKSRDRILAELPWIDRELFSLKSRDSFKGNVARALCCAIPPFDLVIVDEAHNLKHGISWNSRHQTSRNRMLALSFGSDGEEIDTNSRRTFAAYRVRAKRVLFLSATPIENDYRQLYNQFAIFGKGDLVERLIDRDATEDEKRAIAQKFVIRRLTAMKVGEETLTKNLYRREWRSGGVNDHDEPLKIPDQKQRLIVALMQKKVSELLGSERFNQSFQVGMLSSFESFLQTAKVATAEEQVFDDAEQTEDEEERRGIDVHAVNRIADSYWREFRAHLPHPKMDALVDRLAGSFESGEKSLVFVRRVKSVTELQEKLEERYDAWLIARLRNELAPEVAASIEEAFAQYQANPSGSPGESDSHSTDDEEIAEEERDTGGSETFFAWFFRGKGPGQMLSGAAFARRFIQQGSAYATFFDDNYVTDLLGVEPGSALSTLGTAVRYDDGRLRTELRQRAGRHLSSAAKLQRKQLFRAFQIAALELLHDRSREHRDRAEVILQRVFGNESGTRAAEAPDAAQWLETPTFFTTLRGSRWSLLRQEIWPDETERVRAKYRNALEAYSAALTRRELRREMIGSLLRLGHSFIDLYVLAVNRIGTLSARARDESDNEATSLFEDLLTLLEGQRDDPRFRAYRELSEAARNFDLILDVNAPKIWDEPITGVAREWGRLLRSQQPVGGMFTKVNETLVKQFRMPGYPFALITTDLLQEGEDLHTFCSSVYHYGIAWMPSAMEQRIGRIDRVSSQTERRLASRDTAAGDDFLQVFYPHLQETVEVFQVNRVLERMNAFLKLMHERLGGEEDRERYINVADEIAKGIRRVPQIKEKLKTAFPIRREMLRGDSPPLAVPADFGRRAAERMERLLDQIEGIDWEAKTQKNARVGVASVGARRQPFTILLHSVAGRLTVRCVSPIGKIDFAARREEIDVASFPMRVRIGAVKDDRFKEYHLTAEGDVLVSGDDSVDEPRVHLLIQTVVEAADRLEDVLLEIDQPLQKFRNDLETEAQFER